MSSQNQPATPGAQPSQPSPSPTGTWRHPAFSEIARRQNATRFSERDVLKIVWNGAGLFISYIMLTILRLTPCPPSIWTPLPESWTSYILVTVRLLFFFNIVVALSPLFRPTDNLTDIPLTPTQRSLLGLNPDDTPPLTPGGHYITPPRYARSTSRVGTPGSGRSSYNNSPLQGGSGVRTASGSPFSPSSPVTLFQKALAVGTDEARRRSFGATSSLNGSLIGGNVSMSALPSTPSPTSGKGVASVALNNRWLYERGRSTPGTKSVVV
ncbi:MAG: hypothetical protein M1814_001658 [Vezdaea aestivalis]|nr:MAG: hypothetical protein M1814_001658 [Vezdaea aestivalis]